jgi:hypothetical protein
MAKRAAAVLRYMVHDVPTTKALIFSHAPTGS